MSSGSPMSHATLPSGPQKPPWAWPRAWPHHPEDPIDESHDDAGAAVVKAQWLPGPTACEIRCPHSAFTGDTLANALTSHSPEYLFRILVASE